MTLSAVPRFEDLIERHHNEIHAYLWRLLDGAGRTDGALEAGDLTQEVFVRAYRAYVRLRPGSNVRAWLYRIATNCAYTALKRDRHEVTTGDAEDWIDEATRQPEQEAIHSDDLAAIQAAVSELPSAQKAAVVMRYVQGLEYAEIAAALECSEESARANVSHGIRRLRRVLAVEIGS